MNPTRSDIFTVLMRGDIFTVLRQISLFALDEVQRDIEAVVEKRAAIFHQNASAALCGAQTHRGSSRDFPRLIVAPRAF
jgi:hypothetical protein